MNHHRPKQPAQLRTRILEATQQALLEDGMAGLTQERVLARLDISKGGLQHHFRTKQQLVDGLFEHLFAAFVAQYRDALAREPAGPARHVRAYVQVARHADQGEGRALTLLAMATPAYQADWAGFLEEMFAADALDHGVHLACRLFADGLWVNQVIGPAPAPADAEAAIAHVLRMVDALAGAA